MGDFLLFPVDNVCLNASLISTLQNLMPFFFSLNFGPAHKNPPHWHLEKIHACNSYSYDLEDRHS